MTLFFADIYVFLNENHEILIGTDDLHRIQLSSFKDNEELQDLLATGPEKKLKLYEDIRKGVVCQNLEEILVTSASDIFDILAKGNHKN